MKRKKLLQNPIVVILLSCGAVAALVFNTILPLVQEQRQTENTEGQQTGGGATMTDGTDPSLSGTPLSVDTASNGAGSIDTVSKRLAVIGWQRTSGRNPFVPEDSSVKKLPPVIERSRAVPIGSAVPASEQRGGTASKMIRPALTPSTEPRLIAISKGSGGLVALIGSQMVRAGDVCSLGTVTSIDRTSVHIASRRGVRILRLSNSNQGAAP